MDTTHTSPASPLQHVRETVFRLSRPQMAALLGVPYGELHGSETGSRPVSRRIVAGMDALGQDGLAIKAATRSWVEGRAARLAADLKATTPTRG